MSLHLPLVSGIGEEERERVSTVALPQTQRPRDVRSRECDPSRRPCNFNKPYYGDARFSLSDVRAGSRWRRFAVLRM